MNRTSLALRGGIVAAGVVAIGVLVSACSGHPAAEQSPTSQASGGATTTPSDRSTTPSGNPTAADRPVGTSGAVGSDGMTVRYLDKDGTIKTLPVERFHR